MKSLNEDLKTGQFKNIYLLYGEEVYLKKLYKDRLKEAMIPAGDTMNYAYFEGKGVPVAEVIDLAETMPFFAERRLIVIENSGMLKSAADEMAAYMKQVPETTFFLFVENEVDKRGKLYKAIKDKGRIVELSQQDDATLIRWIGSKVKAEKKQIRERTVKYFLEQVGTDMETIEKELEKLFSYTLEQSEITEQDVDAICTTHINNHIFEMVEAVARGQKKKALDYYYDLLALKEPPMRILFLLTRQFRILMQVQSLSRKGIPNKQIASEVGIPPFAVNKYVGQCKNFSYQELKSILEEGATLETDVKIGKLTDLLAVELFIVECTNQN